MGEGSMPKSSRNVKAYLKGGMNKFSLLMITFSSRRLALFIWTLPSACWQSSMGWSFLRLLGSIFLLTKNLHATAECHDAAQRVVDQGHTVIQCGCLRC